MNRREIAIRDGSGEVAALVTITPMHVDGHDLAVTVQRDADDLPTIEYENGSGRRRRVSYERSGETARVVRREYRLLDDGWVTAARSSCGR